MGVIWIRNGTEKEIDDTLKLFWRMPNVEETLKESSWDHKIHYLIGFARIHALEGSIVSPLSFQNR